jgi:hypothetical protein
MQYSFSFLFSVIVKLFRNAIQLFLSLYCIVKLVRDSIQLFLSLFCYCETFQG